jgi:hypothetical protein
MDRSRYFQWHELAALWDSMEFGAVHDWLGERWCHLIQSDPQGQDHPDAQFLQGLSFAALAFHFTRDYNQDGALLLADDALRVLPRFLPSYRGVDVAPVIESLNVLRPLLVGLDPEADCPLRPFTCNKFKFEPTPNDQQ